MEFCVPKKCLSSAVKKKNQLCRKFLKIIKKTLFLNFMSQKVTKFFSKKKFKKNTICLWKNVPNTSPQVTNRVVLQNKNKNMYVIRISGFLEHPNLFPSTFECIFLSCGDCFDNFWPPGNSKKNKFSLILQTESPLNVHPHILHHLLHYTIALVKILK